MRIFSISGRGSRSTEIVAPNWVVALGMALDQYGIADGIQRLACERLQNDTVIARDAGAGHAWVIRPMAEIDLADDNELELVPVGDADPMAPWLEQIAEASSTTFACQVALEAAHKVFPYESASMILESDGALRFVAVVGPFAPNLVGVRIPLGTGVAGFAMHRKKPIVLFDASADPRHYGDMDRLTGHQTRQLLAVPVLHDDRVMGVLEVMNLPEGHRFSRAGIHQLDALARAIGARLAGAPTG